MGFEIIWTNRAVLTLGKRIEYLELHWNEKEIFNFTERVSEYLSTLKADPLIFRKSKRMKNVHIGVIIKQVSVIYRVKPRKNVIELIAFIDNRQKPNRITRE